METREQIEQFLAAQKARRASQGLILTVTSPDGHKSTLYPKNHATLAQWKQGYVRRGYTIHE